MRNLGFIHSRPDVHLYVHEISTNLPTEWAPSSGSIPNSLMLNMFFSSEVESMIEAPVPTRAEVADLCCLDASVVYQPKGRERFARYVRRSNDFSIF